MFIFEKSLITLIIALYLVIADHLSDITRNEKKKGGRMNNSYWASTLCEALGFACIVLLDLHNI